MKHCSASDLLTTETLIISLLLQYWKRRTWPNDIQNASCSCLWWTEKVQNVYQMHRKWYYSTTRNNMFDKRSTPFRFQLNFSIISQVHPCYMLNPPIHPPVRNAWELAQTNWRYATKLVKIDKSWTNRWKIMHKLTTKKGGLPCWPAGSILAEEEEGPLKFKKTFKSNVKLITVSRFTNPPKWGFLSETPLFWPWAPKRSLDFIKSIWYLNMPL